MDTSKRASWPLWLALLGLLGLIPGIIVFVSLFRASDPPAEEPVAASRVAGPGDSLEVPVQETGREERTPAVARTGLRGTILNVRGASEVRASGVPVTLVAIRQGYETTTTTDEQGHFSFSMDNLPQASRQLRVRAGEDDAFQDASKVLEFEGANATYDELELRRLPFAALSGIVVDDRGNGLPGAEVLLGRKREGSWTSVEVTSGPHGKFTVEDTRGLRGAPTATLDGHVLLSTNEVEADGRKAWCPLRLVMTPTATLSVEVRWPDGTPVADVGLSLRIAAAEKHATATARHWGDGRDANDLPQSLTGGRRPPEQRTDANGIARFEQTWCGRRLEVHQLPFGSYSHVDASDLLVAGGDPGARPLVLSPGEDRRLVLRLGNRLRVAGRVFDETGIARPGIEVQVYRLAPRSKELPECHVQTDGAGNYACNAFDLADGELVFVWAHDGERHGASWPSLENSARRTVDPREAEDGTLTVDLALQPTLSLAGRVVDAEGNPAPASFTACREEVLPNPGVAPAGVGRGTVDRHGDFRVDGLEPGTYELRVYRYLEGARSKHVFRGLVAGSEDLELRIPETSDVSIRIRAEAEGLELTCCVAVIEALSPDPEGCGIAAGSIELADLSCWLLRASLWSTGNCGMLSMVYSSDSPAYEWRGLPPGCYRLGIEARESEERMLYPMASEPLEFRSGHHELVAQLRRGGSLSGRVTGAASTEALAVALVDERGRFLPLFPDEKLGVDVLALDARGVFRVKLAPTGNFTLVAGSEAELHAGRPRVRLPLSIRPGENPPISIELD